MTFTVSKVMLQYSQANVYTRKGKGVCDSLCVLCGGCSEPSPKPLREKYFWLFARH